MKTNWKITLNIFKIKTVNFKFEQPQPHKDLTCHWHRAATCQVPERPTHQSQWHPQPTRASIRIYLPHMLLSPHKHKTHSLQPHMLQWVPVYGWCLQVNWTLLLMVDKSDCRHQSLNTSGQIHNMATVSWARMKYFYGTFKLYILFLKNVSLLPFMAGS